MSSRTATVRAAIKAAIEAAVSVPVLDAIEASEARVARYAAFVVLAYAGRSIEPLAELGGTRQMQRWRWDIVIVGGAGASSPATSEDAVLAILDQIEDALTGLKPAADCGPLQAADLSPAELYGSRIGYRYRWQHEYWRG